MENKEKYIRVGTTLYKIVRRPLISGDYIEEKILWSYEALRQDYGKNNLPEIEKYDGFCIIPSHINYQQVYGTFLNQYEPVNHTPCEGDFPYIRLFLEHIFEEQIELGLDYIQLLYTRPTQMLPILLLVSNERETGKTTFLRFLKIIFGKNATFNTNEDFKSQFNADWANRWNKFKAFMRGAIAVVVFSSPILATPFVVRSCSDDVDHQYAQAVKHQLQFSASNEGAR